ncbi:MAG: helix-turn-helix domain-containing protein [Candidatus Levybacteria bacterium]|nr:helix-turn-helix domain-containing protein [Candidatus Levybacteria bacterium]
MPREIPYNSFPEGIGKTIRGRRIDLDIAAKEVAQFVNISIRYFHTIERTSCVPSDPVIDALAYALGIDFAGLKPPQPPLFDYLRSIGICLPPAFPRKQIIMSPQDEKRKILEGSRRRYSI